MKKHEALMFARALRKNATPSERLFWSMVRKRQILGLRFLRQQKIEYFTAEGRRRHFFADFYCHALKLVVEIDGGIHLTQKEYDRDRQDILEGMGFTVIRIRNEELAEAGTMERFCERCGLLRGTLS